VLLLAKITALLSKRSIGLLFRSADANLLSWFEFAFVTPTQSLQAAFPKCRTQRG